VALIAKTAEPHPKLEGTIYTAAEAIEEAGGQSLPIVGDIRDEEQVFTAVEQAVERFGGIDVCVNNASAINLAGTEALEMKRYDLMQDINTRGTFVVSKACIPHLKRAENPHVLTLSPPLALDPKWLKNHVGYTIAKYGMSLCTLGMAAEFADDGIAFNSLWPRTIIATAAVQNLLGGEEAMKSSRKPEIVADAAYEIVTRPSRECTGNLFLAEDVLAEAGITDLQRYSYGDAGGELLADLFVD
jgi:citronellol/citronellal dehydrogenase